MFLSLFEEISVKGEAVSNETKLKGCYIVNSFILFFLGDIQFSVKLLDGQ